MLLFLINIRTYCIEAQFEQNIKNIKKCRNPEGLGTFEAQPLFNDFYKKKKKIGYFVLYCLLFYMNKLLCPAHIVYIFFVLYCSHLRIHEEYEIVE